MNILEKEIEDLLFEGLTNNYELLRSRGLRCPLNRNYVRQPCLGNYGRPDIVGYTISKKKYGIRRIFITVFELKKERVDIETLIQVCRYQTGVDKYLKRSLKDIEVHFDLCLIGKSVDVKSDFVYLFPSLSNVRIFTYNLDLVKGLTFNEQAMRYFISIPSFPESTMTFSDAKEVLCIDEEVSVTDDLPF